MRPIGTRAAILAAIAMTLAAASFAANAIVGDGTPASCSEAALDAAVATANAGGGTLTFACGPDPIVLPISSSKSVTANVIVDGDDRVTLSGGGVTRHFEVMGGADATLRELRLVDGMATSGGAIRADTSSLRLERMTIEGNQSTGDGGAVEASDSVLTIRTSRLGGNQAGAAGGAIHHVGGRLDIGQTILSGNQAATNGGAIAMATFSQFAMILTSVDGNHAGGDGGAIDAQGISGFIDQSSLVRNSASGVGGAVHLAGSSAIALNNNTVGRNVAVQGGGLHVAAGSSSSQVQVTYSDNQATGVDGRGGGIANLGTIQLENSTLSGNITSGSGGGFRNEGAATLRFVTIAFNQADSGGGIASPGLTLQLRNVILAGNAATESGDECSISGGADIAASLWADSTCGTSTSNGNLPETDALLVPLGFSCPPSTPERTRTHDLDPASPAREAGIPVGVSTGFMDQRGVLRPQGLVHDIGAVEYSPSSCPYLFVDNFEVGNTFAWSNVVP